ncbi:MAG: serine/threonine-protein kinase [Nannocystaceae bacterium]|nr:serine/threonine-protein kinase [Nannocystaceae bacterium]
MDRPQAATDAAPTIPERVRPPGPGAPARDVAPPPSAVAPRLARGAQVGRFVVLEPLGEGAMGVVHAAYDPELDRRLAIKLIRERGPGSELGRDHTDRLAREAKAMARLAHPNVVTVFDVGRHGDDLYVAMELVEGTTLRRWAEAAPRHWRATLAVMRDAARGLAAAHAAGIVHRDFKPDNVLVDRSGHARVADFGLARELGGVRAALPTTATTSGDASQTAAGTIVGTPAYMAPELLAGGTADAASDQFAFFVTLHELLYGARPFAGRDLDALARAMTLPPTIPPGRAAAVPAWLRRTIARGLSPDGRARWPSMREVLVALSRERSRARSLSMVALAVGASAGLGAALASPRPCSDDDARLAAHWNDGARAAVRDGFTAVAIDFADAGAARAIAALDDYGERWRAQWRDACEATAVRGEQSGALLDLRMACLQRAGDELDVLLQRWQHADVESVVAAEESIAALPPPERCGDALGLRSAGAEPPPEAREAVAAALHELSIARVARGAAALDEAATALARAREALAGTDAIAAIAELELEEARLAIARGDYLGAATMLQQTIASAERGAHDRARLSALRELGALEAGPLEDHAAGRARLSAIAALWQRLGQPVEDETAIAQLEQSVLHGEGELAAALAAGERAYALALQHAPATATAQLGRNAALLAELGRFDEAQRSATEALAAAGERLGEHHPATADLRRTLAAVYGHQRRWADAEPLLTSALADTRAAFGDRHPRVATLEHQLANALRNRGEHDRALALYRHALAIREAALPADHPKLSDSANTLAVALMDLGRAAESLPLYERALAIRRRAFGERHPQVAMVLSNRAIALAQLGRAEQAEADLREALELREAALGPDHPDTTSTRERLGNRLREQGRLGEAEVALRQALAANERSFGRDSDVVATSLVNLGLLQLDQAQWDEAAQLCDRALEIRQARLGPAHANLVHALDCTGNAALGHGDTARAEAAFTRARELLARTPDRHALWGEASWGLARALVRREPDRAVTLARDALAHYRELGDAKRTQCETIERWLAATR